MKEKVLVTGGAGFIGSHVAKSLIENGYDVVILDDLSGGFEENLPNEAIFVNGSINDTDLINNLFEKNKFSYVFHLAAYAAEGLSHFIKKFNYENNLMGSINLINASANNNVKCFVFTSSIAVYGKNQVPMVEDLVPQPEDPYGIAKYAVELDLKEALEIFGLNYVIFRPHNVYGEMQNINDPYRNVIGIFMKQILQSKPLTVFGDGKQMRAFSYIDDVAPIIAKCINRPETWNQIYNIGADKPYTIIELIENVKKVMNKESLEIKYEQERNEVKIAYSNHDKVKKYFSDLIKNIPLEEGLQRMSKWVDNTQIKDGQKFNNIEVNRNMPPSWKQIIN